LNYCAGAEAGKLALRRVDRETALRPRWRCGEWAFQAAAARTGG